MNRRKLIKIIGGSSLALPAVFQDWKIDTDLNKKIADEVTVLFQGDSITDAGRKRSDYYANQSGGMGGGYVRHAVTHLMGMHPEVDWNFYNRGISGHKVFQLANRWEEDCLQLKPDVLSILIGVNDFWHTLDNGYDGDHKKYENDFQVLLERTLNHLPNVKIIIGQPFVVEGGASVGNKQWDSTFPLYRKISEKMAYKFGAKYIPYQDIFDQALQQAGVKYWCPDGVHPSMAGNYLMAQAWVESFYSLFS